MSCSQQTLTKSYQKSLRSKKNGHQKSIIPSQPNFTQNPPKSPIFCLNISTLALQLLLLLRLRNGPVQHPAARHVAHPGAVGTAVPGACAQLRGWKSKKQISKSIRKRHGGSWRVLWTRLILGPDLVPSWSGWFNPGRRGGCRVKKGEQIERHRQETVVLKSKGSLLPTPWSNRAFLRFHAMSSVNVCFGNYASATMLRKLCFGNYASATMEETLQTKGK